MDLLKKHKWLRILVYFLGVYWLIFLVVIGLHIFLNVQPPDFFDDLFMRAYGWLAIFE